MKALNVFAHLSSVLLVIVCWWILCIQPDFEMITAPLQISIAVVFIFLYLQGLLAFSMKGQKIVANMLDMIISAAVVTALLFIYVFSDTSEIPLWYTLFSMYFMAAIYDLLINNGMLFKLLGLSSAITSE